MPRLDFGLFDVHKDGFDDTLVLHHEDLRAGNENQDMRLTPIIVDPHVVYKLSILTLLRQKVEAEVL